MKAQQFWSVAIVVLMAAVPPVLNAQTPVGTAFTYQAQLKQGGEPLDDTADFEFTLWDDPTSTDPSHQVGPMVPVDNVGVADGLFTVVLDFGVIPFTTGEARWLEIAVRSPSGSGDFTTLEPRQELTPTCFSLATRGINVDAIGNVGIGTPSPAARLDVMGTALVGGFRMPPGAVGGYVLTTDDLGVANWQPPGEFTLPFEGSVASQQPAMKITNTGEGQAIFGEHKLSGKFGYLGGSEAGVYGEAPDGSFGALAAKVNTRSGPVNVGLLAVGPAFGPGSGSHIQNNSGSVVTRLADGDIAVRASSFGKGGLFEGLETYGIEARGLQAGGYFSDLFTSGHAYVGHGDRGISAFGSEAGGYFADDESAPTGYASVGVPNRGIEGFGDGVGGYFEGANYGVEAVGVEAGAYFQDQDGSSNAKVAYGNIGVHATGSEVGGWFVDQGETSYAKLAYVYDTYNRGIEASGQEMGGSFEDTDGTSSAEIASGDLGVKGLGDSAGGYFSGDVWGARGHVSSTGSAEYYGLEGRATGGSGTNYGVYGSAQSFVDQNVSYGVYGSATSLISGQGTNYGVYGHAADGAVNYAGYFEGDVHVTADFSVAGTKVFRIDHPLDRENKYLYHYCLESPEVLNVYRGTVVLDAGGRAWVQLPDYFAEINRDFHYQLTCVGGFAPVYVAKEIEGNRFQIAGGSEGLKVCWMVTAVRDDAYVRQHGAPVELEKPEQDRGQHLDPETRGQTD